MIQLIIPKLPMRSKVETRNYYVNCLGFKEIGNTDFEDYLMLKYGENEVHFFKFKELNPKENYGQIYLRTDNIDKLYMHFIEDGVEIHPNGNLQRKPWGQKEFSLLDPDSNLLTFGQTM